MSATEVIELIKKLPPEEQAVVWNFVTQQKEGTDNSPAPSQTESATERALRIGRGYIERHPDLFRRLAQ